MDVIKVASVSVQEIAIWFNFFCSNKRIKELNIDLIGEIHWLIKDKTAG